jgi:hypothetical protein
MFLSFQNEDLGNMKPQNLKLKTLAGLITASMLSACGGGGSSTAVSSVETSNLTGTVPGTLIEAFCTDGSYYAVSRCLQRIILK